MPGCEHQLKSRTRLKNRSKGFFNGITRRYECENCYKEFESEMGMKQHIASPIHDSNSYRCPGCGVAFVTLSGLVQHVESASCHETIQRGSGSIGKMLHYLQVALRSDNSSEPDGWWFHQEHIRKKDSSNSVDQSISGVGHPCAILSVRRPYFLISNLIEHQSSWFDKNLLQPQQDGKIALKFHPHSFWWFFLALSSATWPTCFGLISFIFILLPYRLLPLISYNFQNWCFSSVKKACSILCSMDIIDMTLMMLYKKLFQSMIKGGHFVLIG